MSIYDKISKNVVVNPLKEKFEGVDDDLIVLLENMLEFNPYFRQQASEILKANIFDKIRDPKLEMPAPCEVHLVDLHDEQNDLIDFRNAICEEVMKIKKKNNVKEK